MLSPHTLKRWRERVTLIIGGLLVGLLLVEVVLRLIGFDYPTVYVADARHGYKLLPGASGWWSREGNAYVRINRDGWRDYDHPKQKPPNTFRIAILGDSFAEALQVAQEETFWHLMAQSLIAQGCFGGQDVEVLNFGVGGYGTAQQLLVLQNDVWEYDPDLVLLAVFVGNDIKNNVYQLNQRSDYVYFVYNDGQLVQDPEFPQNNQFRLRQLYGYGTLYLRVLDIAHMLRDALQARAQQPPSNDAWTELGLDNRVLKPPDSVVWQNAWQITEDLLVMIRDEVDAQEAELLITTLSHGITVHPDSTVRAQFRQHLGVETLFYPDERIRSLADREAIPMVSLGQPFQAYAEEYNVFLHGFENGNLGRGHWNQAGHQLAGELIAQRLCDDY